MISLRRHGIPFLASISAAGLMFFLLWTHAVTASGRGFHQEDTTHGKELFDKYCVQCHRLDSDKKGPRLRGIFGRKSGSVPSFVYSDALKNANVTWDAGTLNSWLADPDKFIPGNNMDFQLQNAEERSAIIGYLKQLSDQ